MTNGVTLKSGLLPKRIQMTRHRPWRCDHPDAVIVARPSRWGNPYVVGKTDRGQSITTRQEAVDLFAEMLTREDRNYPTIEEIVEQLRGKDLACWCPPDQPCHADVLLRVANEAKRTQDDGSADRQ